VHRPSTEDAEAWIAYWEAQGQAWRTEPEISTERQKFLKERLSVIPNRKQGIYPFKGIKLNRADVEWLIDIHGGGQIEHKLTERTRGLDFRGADLSYVDLQRLPLTRLQGVGEQRGLNQLKRRESPMHLAPCRSQNFTISTQKKLFSWS
jgi:hypothetical protein